MLYITKNAKNPLIFANNGSLLRFVGLVVVVTEEVVAVHASFQFSAPWWCCLDNVLAELFKKEHVDAV